ncbi:MAG: DUF4147 domain-containing protein [bacterium]|nr:DUF4147 domain-containing protein [bacterium]
MIDREVLIRLHGAALEVADAGKAVERALRRLLPGHHALASRPIHVLAAGKAAAAMAEGARKVLGTRIVAGELTTKHSYGFPVEGFRVREAGHPVPDRASLEAADAALSFAAALPESHHLLVLLSGGASALWCAPAKGLDLEDKQRCTEALLRSGATIRELNTVRRALSRIKGGGLVRGLPPGSVTTLAVSDVAGDPPEAIGSGPTVFEDPKEREALRILRQYEIAEPDVSGVLLEYLDHEGPPRNGAPRRSEYHVITSLGAALFAAANCARGLGLRTRSLGPLLYGEARDLAPELARELKRARRDGIEILIAGGEPIVTLRGRGKGGRCQELALACAFEIDGDADVTALFAGTDGSDGPTDAAGAFCDGETLTRAREAGLDPADSLARNDSHPLLEVCRDLYRTGPTRTNVNDLALFCLRENRVEQ